MAADSVPVRGIEFEIKGNANRAANGIEKLQESLRKLKASLGDIGLSTAAQNLKKFADAVSNLSPKNLNAMKNALNGFGKNSDKISEVTGYLSSISALDFSNLSDAAKNIQNMASATKSFGGGTRAGKVGASDAEDYGTQESKRETARGEDVAGDAAARSGRKAEHSASQYRKLRDSLSEVGSSARKTKSKFAEFTKNLATAPFRRAADNVKNFANKISQVGAAFKRILFYRLIRTVIKEIGDAFKTGVNNLYKWSTAVGGEFAASMDRMATSMQYFKNSIGAAVAPLLNALAPALDYVIDKVVSFLNVINQFFAKLSGATYWTKANKVAKQYADTASGAGGAAKEALKYLAPFDELNVLSDNSSSGGGGGSGSGIGNGLAFERLPIDFENPTATFAVKVKDVLFNWEDLSGQQIFEKVVAGLSAAAGGVLGFTLGGVPGAIIGSLAGLTIGLVVDNILFDGDPTINGEELLNMIVYSVTGGLGLAIGAVAGGPVGAALGLVIATGITLAIDSIDVDDDTTAATLKKGFIDLNDWIIDQADADGRSYVSTFLSAAADEFKHNIIDPIEDFFGRLWYGDSWETRGMTLEDLEIRTDPYSGIKYGVDEKGREYTINDDGSIELYVVPHTGDDTFGWLGDLFTGSGNTAEKSVTVAVSIAKGAIWVKDAWAALQVTADTVTRKVKAAVSKASEWVADAWSAVQMAGQTVIRTVEAAVQKASTWVSDAWSAVNMKAQTVVRTIYSAVQKAGTWVADAWSAANMKVQSITRTVYSAVQKAGTWISDAWTAAKMTAGSVTRTLYQGIAKASTWVADAWAVFQGKASSVVSVGVSLFKSGWTSLQNFIGSFTKTISLSVKWYWPDSAWWQGVSKMLGWKGYMPYLSFAARGGIVDAATLFGNTVVGEAGKEAIIPLEHHTEWIDKVAARIAAQTSSAPLSMPASNNTDGDGEMIVNALMAIGERIIRAINENGGSGSDFDIDTLARGVTAWQRRQARAMG